MFLDQSKKKTTDKYIYSLFYDIVCSVFMISHRHGQN